MLFFKLTLALLAALGTHVSCFNVTVDENGNLILQTSDTQINWGNQRPKDVLKKLREKCPEDGIGCSKATAVELDSQVIIDGKSYMRKLSVTINEATYPTSGNGGFSQLSQALEALVDTAPFMVSSKQHWDQDTEQSSCTNNNNNFCWSACESIISHPSNLRANVA